MRARSRIPGPPPGAPRGPVARAALDLAPTGLPDVRRGSRAVGRRRSQRLAGRAAGGGTARHRRSRGGGAGSARLRGRNPGRLGPGGRLRGRIPDAGGKRFGG
ncbi:MAG: hypothetical protein F4Z12_02085 [Acidobacteria bacterium]|nr:hypothetical protein [Acidobacteriota bacterium]MYI97394.1 hypothetical protein [Acidobacteriota bacterium]